ncbi:hypothetical protein CDAR_89411 [Caerostris darwini]|uniref:Uncharacterized protein n=1 Tax=Caerostris darwini TaxID=1538125 RepID=A0AAV4N8N1_9ARAC|nr:hypothetical protein CDAR_89411 [Caerostris darwini]
MAYCPTTGALKRSKLHANCRYCLPLLGIEAYRKSNGKKRRKKSLKKFKAYPPPPLFEKLHKFPREVIASSEWCYSITQICSLPACKKLASCWEKTGRHVAERESLKKLRSGG